MEFHQGNPAAQSQTHVARPVLTGEDVVYDQTFENYISQDMFSNSHPANASPSSMSGVAGSSHWQAGGNMTMPHTAPESTNSHELVQYPQQWGHFPSGGLQQSAEQQQPQAPDAYPHQQDDYMHDIPTNQGNGLFQFAQSPGVEMANTDLQNIPNSYQQVPNSYQQFPNPYQQFPNPYQQFPNPYQQFPNSSQQVPNSFQQPFTPLLRPSDAPVHVQPPDNTDISTAEQFQAFCDSLPPQTHDYIEEFLTDEAAKTQAGVVGDPVMNGVYILGAQPGEQGVYQSNLQWNQTATADMSMTYPESQSQMQPEYNVEHAQAQMQMETQMPFIPDGQLPGPPNYQSQQMPFKPPAVEYMERSYGITIRPEDYEVFNQGQNFRHKHDMSNGYGQNPWASAGHQLPEFVQGSSRDGANSFQHMQQPAFGDMQQPAFGDTQQPTPGGPSSSNQSSGALPEMTSTKRKREDDDVATAPPRPHRRRRKALPHPYTPPPSSVSPSSSASPHAESETPCPTNEDFLDSSYVCIKGRGTKASYRCLYRHPFKGDICNIVVGGRDRRNRYRHLSTHAQLEENLVAHGHLNIANAVVFTRLRKLVVTCDIAGCNFAQEVWRTEHIRENHERECHMDVYMGRLQEREDKKAKKLAEEISQWQGPNSEGNN